MEKPVRPVYVNSSLSVPSSVNGTQPYHLLSDKVDLRDGVVVVIGGGEVHARVCIARD